MGKLTLKFGNRLLKEVPISENPVTIGRSLDSDIQIDNLGVSHHHARIYVEQGQLMVEDLNSANGVYLNQSRVTKEPLHSGDTILIGKHSILVDEKNDVAVFSTTKKVVTPRLEETFVVGVKRSGAQGQAQAQGNVAVLTQEPPRTRVASLVVLRGRADRKEYPISFKLIVIGKSSMATVKLRGWFAPQVAAQINRRQDGYYLTATDKRVPKVNGEPIARTVRLNDGDKIQFRGLLLEFVDRD